jgi:hypothetical protein
MSDAEQDKGRKAGKARHGPRSEVVWSGGAGRQPYGNQESGESAQASGEHEFAAGDRGELSGRNLEQSEKAKGTP